MKKKLKVLITIIILIALGLFIYYVFKEVKPIDDTKKLYITCNGNTEKYDIISGTEINYNKNNCKVNLEVRNVEKNYLKLKTSSYFYGVNGNNKINEGVLFNDLYVSIDETLVLYSYDSKIKYEFEYK